MSALTIPPELIATSPAPDRDRSRLMVYNRSLGEVTHAHFFDLEKWLEPGDLLVFNDARVDPVRVEWQRSTGGISELLLLKHLSDESEGSMWEAIVSGRESSPDENFELPMGMRFHVVEREKGGLVKVFLSSRKKRIQAWLKKVGQPPVPPYIRKARKRLGLPENSKDDSDRYQTVFAERAGAVAAPTAGLHFTTELIQRLTQAGVHFSSVTLFVGWGTFAPLTQEHFLTGKLHSESVIVPPETATAIEKSQSMGHKVVAVGTTVVRSLEWWAGLGAPVSGAFGDCDLFLRPPWQPAMVDALITNFHLPDSSLLQLVSGFLRDIHGKKVEELYRMAVDRQYRFYSYGDAMLIL